MGCLSEVHHCRYHEHSVVAAAASGCQGGLLRNAAVEAASGCQGGLLWIAAGAAAVASGCRVAGDLTLEEAGSDCRPVHGQHVAEAGSDYQVDRGQNEVGAVEIDCHAPAEEAAIVIATLNGSRAAPAVEAEMASGANAYAQGASASRTGGEVRVSGTASAKNALDPGV